MEWKSQALEVLAKTLRVIPVLHLEMAQLAAQTGHQHWPHLLARVICNNQSFLLAVHLCHTGEPRYVRQALAELNAQTSQAGRPVEPLLMAPYFMPMTRELCADAGVGCLDLQGNVQLSFGTIYIERHLSGPPARDQRARRSLFKPQASRMLRAMFRSPGRPWLVAELSETAQVSLGLVSDLGSVLRDKGLAVRTRQGLSLREPDDLLDGWAEHYSPRYRQELELTSALEPAALQHALETFELSSGRAIRASFSAAGKMLPGFVHHRHYFYADEAGLADLVSQLKLSPAPDSRHASIRITVPDETGILDDAVDCGVGLFATSPVQTYLDLWQSGKEGKTAADRLRAAGLWPK